MAFLKFMFPLSYRRTALTDVCFGLLVYAGIAFVALLQFTICWWLKAVGAVPVVILIIGMAYALSGCGLLLGSFFTAVHPTVHKATEPTTHDE